MKKYIKPILFMEEFTPNEAITACDRLPTGNYKYKSVTIQCLAQSSDNIFTSSDMMEAGHTCTHIVDPNGSSSDYFFYQYNDKDNSPGDGLYFAWIGPQEGQSTNELEEVMKAAGYTSLQAGNRKVWHCGKVDDYMQQLYSHS